MTSRQLRPCPLCGGLAPRGQLDGARGYNKILCQRCGSFVVEPTLPAQPWARLAAEDMRLVVFLPAYIRHQNRRNHTPLLTPGNWRAKARRGRVVASRSPWPAPVPEEPTASIARDSKRHRRTAAKVSE